MSDIKITFFMIVTDPDVIIADYAVRSYAKIKDVSFKLQVYSNWISSAQKRKYFPDWRKFDFVEIIENEWQTDENKPTHPQALNSPVPLGGPYERCEAVWDRELRKIQTPYHATVDADFEILDARFVPVMLEQLDRSPKLVAMSTDYNPRIVNHYDSYSNEIICLNERWGTWFCIYKREAFQCQASHFYYEEIISGPVRRNVWDSAGYFQKALKEIYGYEIAVLERKYQRYFIHYGAFSKNRQINENNIALYRRLRILQKAGLFDNDTSFTSAANVVVKKVAARVNRALIGHADRSKYWEGWGKG